MDIFPPRDGECHASTLLELKNGDLLAAWFQGSKESHQDVRIYWSRCHGGAWSGPQILADALDVPHWNPVLFRLPDGGVTLFFKAGFEIRSWKTYTARFDEENGLWSAPRELCPGDDSGGRGPVKNKPILLQDGSILAPASQEGAVWRAFVERSADGGETWERMAFMPRPVMTLDDPDRSNELAVIQPTLWESRPGCVHALLRSNCSRICRSDSADGGRTWSLIYPIDLPNNNSGLDLDRAADGTLYLACNPIAGTWGPRYDLALFKSTDNGVAWSRVATLAYEEPKSAVLAEMPEFSYPAVLMLRDGRLAVSFTNKRRTITVRILTLDELEK